MPAGQSTRMDRITLERGGWRADVAPALGGGLLSAAFAGVDVLRPATAEGIGAGDPLSLACFPLVPFSNRIRRGRFSFRGVHVALSAPAVTEPEVIHGFGWTARWRPQAVDPHACSMTFVHDGGAWPWPFTARRHVRLSETSLELALSVENTGEAAMPLGLGFHPYFPKSADCHLHAPVSGLWVSGSDRLPIRHQRVDGALGFQQPQAVADLDLDHCFTGWSGTARIDWPERGLAVRLEAGGPLDHLVLYVPPTADFFCVEPVSHMVDAFNWDGGPDHTGTLVLDPGQSVGASMALTPERSGEAGDVSGH